MFVGDAVEHSFDHDGLEYDDEDVEGGEEVASSWFESPFMAVVFAGEVYWVLDFEDAVESKNGLHNTDDSVVDDVYLKLLSENRVFLVLLIFFNMRLLGIVEELGYQGEQNVATDHKQEGVGIVSVISAVDSNSWQESSNEWE